METLQMEVNMNISLVEEGNEPDGLMISGGKPERVRPMRVYPTYVTWNKISKRWVCD
jgi:hypothetical protein